jgi:signal transduction histidine kinase
MVLKTVRNKSPQRAVYEKIHIFVSIPFAILLYLSWGLGWRIILFPPPELLYRIIILASIPLILLSLYFTSIKRIFPQRIGDVIHFCILILVTAVPARYYGETIGGSFVYLFFLYPILSTFLLDTFLPIFIGSFVSFLLFFEFILITDFSTISFMPFYKLFLQILGLQVISFTCSNLVKRTLKEQETTERLRQAYEELKRLDIAKSEFISIASHQLRTPLSAIKGYLSMILEGSYGKLPEKVKKPMENVFVSNERLIKLVNDILSVSKIEAGEMEMNWKREDLREIIKEVISELSIKAKEKNLYLNFEEPKEFPKILLDREKIRQVILNLVDNAIRYTQKGGVTVKLQIANGKLQIVVSDTGEGLTKEEKEKLFERFSRGTAGTKFWTEGAGLGLYIARKFMEMHNGKIWAESEGRGKGSTFYVELPMK